MAYNEKQRSFRRCKVVKANGEQCKSYSKIGSDSCALHLYDHKTKVLPKANEREAARIRREKKRAEGQRRATCKCTAYPFVHRLSSGFCRYPDLPRFRLVKPFGKRASSPGVEQNKKHHAGGGSEWERVIDYEGPNEVETVSAEERERIKRQTKQDDEEITPHEILMSKIWSGKV